jgi:hypothetical protein
MENVNLNEEAYHTLRNYLQKHKFHTEAIVPLRELNKEGKKLVSDDEDVIVRYSKSNPLLVRITIVSDDLVDDIEFAISDRIKSMFLNSLRRYFKYNSVPTKKITIKYENDTVTFKILFA